MLHDLQVQLGYRGDVDIVGDTRRERDAHILEHADDLHRNDSRKRGQMVGDTSTCFGDKGTY